MAGVFVIRLRLQYPDTPKVVPPLKRLAIDCRVGDTSGGEGIAALAAGGALAAVQLAAAVAGIGVREIYAKLGTDGSDFSFGVGNEGPQNLQVGIGAM